MASLRTTVRRRLCCGATATSALAPPSAHADRATATQSLRAFVGVCRGEAPFVGAEADVGVQVTSAIHTMHESARTGQPPQPVDARASDDVNVAAMG